MNLLFAESVAQIANRQDAGFAWWQVAMLVLLVGFLLFCMVRSHRRRD